MKYNEAKARQIQQQYNIPENTLLKWRQRGIPDKYKEKLITIEESLWKVDLGWWEKYLSTITIEESLILTSSYLYNLIPKSTPESKIKNRLRAFRTYIQNK